MNKYLLRPEPITENYQNQGPVICVDIIDPFPEPVWAFEQGGQPPEFITTERFECHSIRIRNKEGGVEFYLPPEVYKTLQHSAENDTYYRLKFTNDSYKRQFCRLDKFWNRLKFLFTNNI